MSLRAVRSLATRPELWPTAVVELGRLARPGWWHWWPPLPRPDPDYLGFRMQTAYGDPDAVPSPHELVEYLEWCPRMDALTDPMSRSRRWRRASVAPVSPEPPAAGRPDSISSPGVNWRRR